MITNPEQTSDEQHAASSTAEIYRALDGRRPHMRDIDWTMTSSPDTNSCVGVTRFANDQGDEAVLVTKLYRRNNAFTARRYTPIIAYDQAEWSAFVQGVLAGEFEFDDKPNDGTSVNSDVLSSAIPDNSPYFAGNGHLRMPEDHITAVDYIHASAMYCGSIALSLVRNVSHRISSRLG